jgi:hypothetical protein
MTWYPSVTAPGSKARSRDGLSDRRLTGVGHRHHRSRGPRRVHAEAEAGPPRTYAAGTRRRPADGRPGRGGHPGLGDRHRRDDGRLPGGGRRHPPGRHPRRGVLAAHPRAEHQRQLRDVRGGPAGRDAASDLRLVQPRGGIHPAFGVPGARLRLSRAGHLLRRLQGQRRGAGRDVPPPVRPGRGLRADTVLLPAAGQRANAIHLAVAR